MKAYLNYTAHDSKGLDSLLEDNILPALTKETTVMHDHNKVNYNNRSIRKHLASYYAIVKTYVETCRKNQINEMEALSRLCAGNFIFNQP